MENITGTPGKSQTKERTVILSLLCDIGMWIPAIIAVVLSGSVTLFADVMKDGNEILATVFALAILLKIKNGAGVRYDYGMGKFEVFTRVMTGVVMLISLFIVFVSAFHRIFVPKPLEAAGAYIAIPLMFVSAIIDIYLWRKNYQTSKIDPSPVMEAQWRLRRAKVVSDIVVLLSFILSFALAAYAWSVYIDPALSFVIVGFLLVAGFNEISSSLPDLFDKTLEEGLQIVILRELSAFFDEYHAFYGVRSRRSGGTIYIDIFLGFDPARKMGEVQGTSDRIKASLEEKIPGSIVSIVPTSGQPTDRHDVKGSC